MSKTASREFLTLSEVASTMGVDIQSVKNWEHDPENSFPKSFRTPGGRRRWSVAAIRDWKRRNGWPEG